MTIKIITWIKTSGKLNQSGNNFSFEIEPFDYKGQRIDAIEVAGGNKNHYERYLPDSTQSNSYNSRARVEINLQENEIERVRKGNWGDFLVIKGNVDIKEWKGPNELRFKLTKKSKWGLFNDYKVDLKMEKNDQWLANGYLTPEVEGFQITFRDESVREEFFARMKEGEEYTISDISWNGAEWVGLGSKLLNLNYHGGGQPTIKSEKEKQASSEQVARKEAAKKRVSEVITRARKASDKLFEWGYINKNKEDFQEAVRALSDLIKIAKHGNKEEKEEYQTYRNWQEGSEGFKKLKDTIYWTSVNNKQGWKYDLDKGEINWGSTDQIKNNQGGKNSGNNDNSKKETKNEVKQDIAKRDEEAANKLNNSLQGLTGKTEAEKENSLADIEKLKNEGKTYEEQKDKITEKKNELAQNDPVGYGKIIAKVLEQKITEFKVEITKLGQEIGVKLTKLKNGEFTSDTEVRQAEEEVSEKVSEEVANVELNNLMAQAQKILKSATDSLRQQIAEIRKNLYSFQLSANTYQQRAYQNNKSQVEKLERAMDSYLNQNQTNSPTPWGVIIPVSLAAVAVIGIAAAVIVRNRKQTKLKIKK